MRRPAPLLLLVLLLLPAVLAQGTEGELRGVVRDEAGAPVAGVAVRAFAIDTRHVATTTDADGAYVLRLAPTTYGYTLVVDPPLDSGLDEVRLDCGRRGDPTCIPMEAGRVERRDVTLVRMGEVRGVVRAPDGSPAANHMVVSAQAREAVLSGEDGAFRIRVSPGVVGVAVAAGNNLAFGPAVVRCDALFSSDCVRVAPGGTAWANLTLLPAGAIEGVVRDPLGTPVFGARLVLLDPVTRAPVDPLDPGLEDRTGRDGRYRLRAPPGLWGLGVRAEEDGLGALAPRCASGGSPCAEVRAGNATRLDVTLPWSGEVAGNLTLPPRAVTGGNVLVLLEGRDALVSEETSGEAFRVRAPPGDYALTVLSLDGSLPGAPGRVRVPCVAPDRSDCVRVEANRTTRRDVAMPEGGWVESNVSAGRLRVWDASGADVMPEYGLLILPPGRYAWRAEGPEGAAVGCGPAPCATMAEGGRLALDGALPERSGARGRVALPANATPSGRLVVEAVSAGASARVLAEADGAFALRLPPGVHDLVARDEGLTLAGRGRVEVPAEGAGWANLTLAPLPDASVARADAFALARLDDGALLVAAHDLLPVDLRVTFDGAPMPLYGGPTALLLAAPGTPAPGSHAWSAEGTWRTAASAARVDFETPAPTPTPPPTFTPSPHADGRGIPGPAAPLAALLVAGAALLRRRG